MRPFRSLMLVRLALVSIILSLPVQVSANQNQCEGHYSVRTGPYRDKASAVRVQRDMKARLTGNKSVQGSIVARGQAQCAGQANKAPAARPTQAVTPSPAQQLTPKNENQCFLRNGVDDVSAIQLMFQTSKVSGYYFWRPDGRDGAYGSLQGSIVNDRVVGKRHYQVEGDTGTDDFSYVLTGQRLMDGNDTYNRVSCDRIKSMIDVSKAVSKDIAMAQSGSQRTTLRFSHYPVSRTYKGKNHALVMSDFAKTFRTRLRRAIQTQKPSFAGHYIVTTWGCGSSGCNTGAVINAKTGVATPLPVALASVFPLKPAYKHEDGQEHIYRVDSRLMIFAGNLSSDNSAGNDMVEFYEFQNGKFIFLEAKPYGRAVAY